MKSFRFIFLLIVFVVSIGCTPQQSDAPSAPTKIGALSCFSITPKESFPGMKIEEFPPCDTLCAQQGAICTGMQNGGMNPPVTCADSVSRYVGICRCCKVAS